MSPERTTTWQTPSGHLPSNFTCGSYLTQFHVDSITLGFSLFLDTTFLPKVVSYLHNHPFLSILKCLVSHLGHAMCSGLLDLLHVSKVPLTFLLLSRPQEGQPIVVPKNGKMDGKDHQVSLQDGPSTNTSVLNEGGCNLDCYLKEDWLCLSSTNLLPNPSHLSLSNIID